MTISGSGFNFNYHPQPTYEHETAGSKNLQNQGNLGLSTVIVPQSQQDLIPFTKLNDRNVWQYKTNTNHPTLHPMGTLRMTGAKIQENVGDWENYYNEFLKSLSDETLAVVQSNLTSAESTRLVLEFSAKFLVWQDLSVISLQSENALVKAKTGSHLAEGAFYQSLKDGKEIVETFNTLFENFNLTNDAQYVDMHGFIDDLRALFKEVRDKQTT